MVTVLLMHEDLCPLTKGTVEGKGCPDYDGDGVFDMDENDKCPGVAGPRGEQWLSLA